MADSRSDRNEENRLDESSEQRPVPLGAFDVMGRIGSGGMANVYRGRHHDDTSQWLAIKCMKPKLATEDRFIEMFTREARLAKMLDHPAIVHTVDSGYVDGCHYIVMEYIAGQDLNNVLKRCHHTKRRLPVPHSLYIAAEISRALDFAHGLRDSEARPLNVVNRDVSPANVRLSYEGEVRLLDFGIAQAMMQVSSEIGILKGKFAYMSPEQIRGLPVNNRSDTFSLGIVLHEMLTGDRLFKEDSEFALMERVRQADVRAPSVFNKRITAEVDELVMSMLSRDAARRPSASEVEARLSMLLERYRFSPVELGEFVRGLFPADFRDERERTISPREDEEPAPIKKRRRKPPSVRTPVLGQEEEKHAWILEERPTAWGLFLAAALLTFIALGILLTVLL
ncbi:MAG: serine/threonine protein kinase [Deltaproteobacteria bacterium]|nr:serine/threonine protein kinase [Deltaproteobacteria bacterium]